MDKPRISNDNWAMTMTHRDSYGEELWTLNPCDENWMAVVHLQPCGKMYITVMCNKRSSSKNFVNQEILVDAIHKLSQKIYEERDIICSIGIPAKPQNTKLFSTVRKAGFRKTSDRIKVRRRPYTIVYRYIPNNGREEEH